MVDHLIDTYLANGMRPYLEIGFMPQALSSAKPGTPCHLIAGAWDAPPKDYAKWDELVYQWVRHCVERYGRAEVAKWAGALGVALAGLLFFHGGPAVEIGRAHDDAAAYRAVLPLFIGLLIGGSLVCCSLARSPAEPRAAHP